MTKLNVPLQLFTPDECVQIVLWERDDNKIASTKLYEKAKNDFKHKYPDIKV